MDDVKQYLKKVRWYDERIDRMIEEKQSLLEMATKVTTNYSADPVAACGNGDKVGSAAGRIVDLEREINQCIDAFADSKRDINRIVNRIEDTDQMNVIVKRYLQYKSWEQIAEEMSCTKRNVCYIHGRALQSVRKMMGE